MDAKFGSKSDSTYGAKLDAKNGVRKGRKAGAKIDVKKVQNQKQKMA